MIAILGSIVTIASLLANITPTDSDNIIVTKFAKIVDFLALNFTIRK